MTFIKAMLQKGKEAKDKVKAEFSSNTSKQLNWQPAPESWSIAQCLEHLIISDNLYFPTLRKITKGQYSMTNWERWSPFSGICGRILVNQLQEVVKRKMKTPKILYPTAGHIEMKILDRFYKHQDIFLEYIASCDQLDLDRIFITSPTIKIVTYSLRDAIKFLIQHEHRHINQAIRVKSNAHFPKKQ